MTPKVVVTPEVVSVPKNYEISLTNREMWARNEIIVDHVFAYEIANDIVNDEEREPQSVEECRHRNDWPKWKEAIQAELNSL